MMITNQRTKNYYIYKAKWIPDNPIETFGIFVEHLVTSEKILNCKIERLSSIYEDKYGYKLPLFILHPILDNFASKQYAKKERNEWKFNLNIIPAHNYDKYTRRDSITLIDIFSFNSQKCIYNVAVNLLSKSVWLLKISFSELKKQMTIRSSEIFNKLIPSTNLKFLCGIFVANFRYATVFLIAHSHSSTLI